jgi:hypothetical protein
MDVLTLKVCMKLVLQVSANSLAIRDPKNGRLRIGRFKFGELPGLILEFQEQSPSCRAQHELRCSWNPNYHFSRNSRTTSSGERLR